jgi:hypothetical protein
MRLVLLTTLCLTIISCQSRQTSIPSEIHKDSTSSKIPNLEMPGLEKDKNTENKPPCDSTKFKDFKNNLIILKDLNLQKYYKSTDLQAREYINNECKKDTLYCGVIFRKIEKTYTYNVEWKFFLFGYAYEKDKGMEKNSASFFILTILRNDEVWFTDILEDLMGEIKVDLNGFEDQKQDGQVIIWGHIYPYFSPDYGKFELTINNGATLYEYECHETN